MISCIGSSRATKIEAADKRLERPIFKGGKGYNRS